MTDKTINVGLIGFGTVGSGVVDLFLRKKPSNIKLKTIAVKDTNKTRKPEFSNITSDVNKVIEDPEIDIVVELIGGYEPAKDYIIKAIQNKKHVITANKAVISEFGPEIFKEAEKYRVNIGFEGAVGGGIPIINPLLEQLSIGDISSITGILNGTTNYMLTRMSEGMDYEGALRIAKDKGFAEADHSFDVKGLDAAQKIAILASLAFGKWVTPKEVYCEGITRITQMDIEYAKELGYVIKLLAIAKKTEEGIDVRVHPALVEKSHRLARVNEEFNAIYIQGTPFDEYFNVGKGAGKGPTAFSVYYDIIKIAEMIKTGIIRKLRVEGKDEKIVADQNKISTEGYLRLYLQHVPGSLHSVLGVLSRHGWSVKNSIQRSKYERKVDGVKCLPDIITHEPLPFGVIKDTLPELKNLKTEKGKPIHGEPFYMRIYNQKG